MHDPIVSLDVYLTQASQELTTLAESPFQRKDGHVTLDRISELVIGLAEKNAEDHATVNEAILKGQARIAREDHTAALNLTANAAEAAPAGSKLEMELIERWSDLMIGDNLEHRNQLFPFAKNAFEDSQKPALKAAAGSEVVELANVNLIGNDLAQLQPVKAVLQSVQTFAFKTENLDLANGAGKKISVFNSAIEIAKMPINRAYE